jgi:hypothetical protein
MDDISLTAQLALGVQKRRAAILSNCQLPHIVRALSLQELDAVSARHPKPGARA